MRPVRPSFLTCVGSLQFGGLRAQSAEIPKSQASETALYNKFTTHTDEPFTPQGQLRCNLRKMQRVSIVAMGTPGHEYVLVA